MIKDGWVDWADTSIKGHPEKVYREPNRAQGIILHSVVGDLPGYGIPHRFLSDERLPDGRFTPYAAASVQFILYRDGHLRQMYPVTASTWTSGGYEANTGYWSVELEGGFAVHSEPITVDAAFTLTKLVLEFEEYTGRKVFAWNLMGHNEAARKWGYAPTACPSGRYDWWRHLMSWGGTKHAMMTLDDLLGLEDRLARVERLLAGWGRYPVVADQTNLEALETAIGRRPAIGEEVELNGLQTLTYLDLMQNNMWLGLKLTQERVGKLEAGK